MAAGKQARQHSEQDGQRNVTQVERTAERDAMSALLPGRQVMQSGQEDIPTRMQQTLGNRAVGELLKPKSHQRGQLPLVVQPKLMIGEPNDRYEQEADLVAQQVVQRMNAPQDKPQEAMDEEPIVRRAGGINGGLEAPEEVAAGIAAARGGGQPLDERVRENMERAFGGADFRGVRVHTDVSADALNYALGSLAFTTQQDLFFRQGEYQPKSLDGQRLLAHELSHSIQQKTQDGYHIQTKKKKNPGNVWAYLQHISSYILPGKDGGLLEQRQKVLKHIGSPNALYARFAQEQIVDLMSLDTEETNKLQQLWGWKDPISRENEIIGSDHSLAKYYGDWKGKQERSMEEILEWGGYRSERLDQDPVLTRLKNEYEEERAKAIEKDAPSFAWQGKMYDPSKDFEHREVRLYDTGTAVSADTGKRFAHALANPLRGVKGAIGTAGKGVGEVIKHAGHLDAARKEGKLENAKKVASFTIKSAAIAGAMFIPQLGAIIKLVDDLTSKGVEDWLDHQYDQYNAQIMRGDLGILAKEEEA